MALFQQIIVHRPPGGAHAHTNSATALAALTTRGRRAPTVREGVTS